MKKFTETIADDDYRNSDGLLVCGRCGTPKEMRLSTELLGGHTAIVPIPCECMKRAEAERRERELGERALSASPDAPSFVDAPSMPMTAGRPR